MKSTDARFAASPGMDMYLPSAEITTPPPASRINASASTSREAARVMAQRLENAGVPDVLDRFLGDEG